MNAKEARKLVEGSIQPRINVLEHLEKNILEAATRKRRMVVVGVPVSSYDHDIFTARNSLLQRGYSVIIKKEQGILAENLVRFPSITFEVSW